MFFPKLRRRAKWVFLFLALAFAGSFVFFGVGAGGSGIGDYISDLFNRQPSTGTPSLDDARDAAAESPKDAQAQVDLGRAAQAEGELDEAITAYQAAIALNAKDTDSMRALAALYGRQIADAQQRATIARNEAAEANLPSTLAPSDSDFLRALTENKLSDAVASRFDASASAANAEVRQLSLLQLDVYRDLTLLVDDDPLLWLQFAGAAETAQDYKSAITAYEQYLDLQPNSPQAEQIQNRIDTLKVVSGASAPDTGTGGSDDGSND